LFSPILSFSPTNFPYESVCYQNWAQAAPVEVFHAAFQRRGQGRVRLLLLKQ